MKLRFNRYSTAMLTAIARQSYVSLCINALMRGVLFTIILQLIALASTGQLSSLTQLIVLVVVFSFIVLSVDIVERAWATYMLRKRN